MALITQWFLNCVYALLILVAALSTSSVIGGLVMAFAVIIFHFSLGVSLLNFLTKVDLITISSNTMNLNPLSWQNNFSPNPDKFELCHIFEGNDNSPPNISEQYLKDFAKKRSPFFAPISKVYLVFITPNIRNTYFKQIQAQGDFQGNLWGLFIEKPHQN